MSVVKWCCIADLEEKAEAIAVYGDQPVAVMRLTDLAEIVEGLRNIESRCDLIAALSGSSGSIAEAHLAMKEVQRLLAQLEPQKQEAS